MGRTTTKTTLKASSLEEAQANVRAFEQANRDASELDATNGEFMASLQEELASMNDSFATEKAKADALRDAANKAYAAGVVKLNDSLAARRDRYDLAKRPQPEHLRIKYTIGGNTVPLPKLKVNTAAGDADQARTEPDAPTEADAPTPEA